MILVMTGHRGTETQSHRANFFSLETHSANSVLHYFSVEIQDQADTQSRDAQVREHLCDKYWIEGAANDLIRSVDGDAVVLVHLCASVLSVSNPAYACFNTATRRAQRNTEKINE